MNPPQNYFHPYGFCPKCSTPLVYNRYNQLIVCPRLGCDYSRDFNAQDYLSVNNTLAKEFQRNQEFDRLYEVKMAENIFDKVDERKG